MADGKVLYLVRHGITDHNVAGLVQGELDSKLTPNGVNYSLMVGDIICKLEGQKNSIIYASPLMRTRQTAELISHKINSEIIFDTNLVELKRGIIEGKNKDSFTSEDLEQISKFKIDPWHYRITGGENYSDLYKRCEAFIVEKRIRSLETSIIIVSHGFTIRMLLLILEKQTPAFYDEIRAPHNLIYKISFSNNVPQIEMINVEC